MADPTPSSRLPADLMDPRLYDELGEIPASLFDERFYWSVELVDRYGREWAVELAHRLGLADLLREPRRVPELLEALELAESFSPALTWVLERLVQDGLADRTGAGNRDGEGAGQARFRLPLEGLRPAARETVREAALEADPENAPFLDLLDLAGEAYPRVARGEVTGEAALLGMGQTSLWLRYFSNANPVYGLNNRLAALAAVNRFPARESAGGGAVRVLEVGAGAGGATTALLEEADRAGRRGDLAQVRVTEPAAFFRRRAERGLPEAFEGVPFAFGALDIDGPWEVETGSQHIVWGVNVFHVAQDLEHALTEAHRVLAPGGWLVIGECLRQWPRQAVAAEMPFLLMEGFLGVDTDPEFRPHPGFLTIDHWQAALERVGFGQVEPVPDLRRIREIYGKFTTGAVCGQKGG